MATREQARIEAAFARGDTGVDGGATEEETRDEAQVERDKAREQLLRGRAYLGREFLTWLLWRSEGGGALVQFEDTGLEVLYLGRCTLRGVNGDVTEMMAKGTLAPYSENVRHSLDRGLLVHQARLRFTHGEKVYEVTLDAEFLDIRAAKLPELMTEEEDDQLLERLYLTEQLSGMVDALVVAFLQVRASRNWNKKVVPDLKAWMKGEAEESAGPPKTTKVQLARAARG